MYLYCQAWKLENKRSNINKILYEKEKKNRENPAYIYNNESIAVVDDFVHLCITFTHNAYFTKHKNPPFRIESKSYV